MNERMERFWSWLAVTLGKRAGLVSMIGLLITVTLGAGITRLEFTSGQDAYLNTTDQVYKDNVAYQKLFGGEAMLTVITMDKGHTVAELLNDQNRPKLVATGKKLAANKKDILGVITPVDALNLSNNLVSSKSCDLTQSIAGKATLDAQSRAPAADQAKRLADASTTLTRAAKVPCADQTIANQDWVKFLLIDNQGEIRKALLPFFPDQRHALIITRLQGNASIEQEGRGADYTIATMKPVSFPHATIVTGGAAVLLNDINKYLKGGMLLLGGIAIAIMIVILLVLFDVRWRLLPLGIVLIGVIWAFGLAGYLGIPLTLVTISGLPVMLGIGIDYSIQMHARVEEEVVIDHSEHPIQESARNLGPALLVVTFDAIFAFAALRFSKVPMIRSFGLLLAVGVAAICFCSIAGTLSALGIREYRSPTKRRDYREGPLGRLVVWLGSLTWKAAPFLAVAALIVFVGGVLVENKLEIQTDPIEWVNPSSTAVQNIHKIERQAGISSELGMYVVSKDAFSDKSVKFMDGFTTEQLCRYGDAARAPEQCPADAKAVQPDKRVLANASSIVSIVSFLTEVPGTRVGATDGRPGEAGVRFGAARHPEVDGEQGRQGEQPHLRHHTRVARQARGRGEGDPQAPRAAGRDSRHAVGPRGRRRGPPRQPRVEPDPAHLPRDHVRVPLPRHPAAVDHPIAVVARARAHRGGSRVAVRVLRRLHPQSDDGGGRTLRRRGLHRVHLADPAALRRGAAARTRAPSGGRRRGGTHRPGLHRVRPHRDLGDRRAVGVVAAAVARLRHHRRGERGRRAAQRAGRAPAHARLGRSSQLGVARPREAPGRCR